MTSDRGPGEPLVPGPSIFLPGRTPVRFQPDPRVTAAWRRVRKAVLVRDHFSCRRCGRAATDIDHVVELIDGGSPFAPENLQALCEECHDAKTSESRYRRAQRVSSSWGRMTVCPKCEGTGRCALCAAVAHACGCCLGIRVLPEAAAVAGEIPSQTVLAEVSSLAWAGAEPPRS